MARIKFDDIHGTDAQFTNPNDNTDSVLFNISGFGVTKKDKKAYEEFKKDHPDWIEEKFKF